MQFQQARADTLSLGGRGSARTPVYSLAYCIRGAVAGGGGAEACNRRSVDHCCFVCFH